MQKNNFFLLNKFQNTSSAQLWKQMLPGANADLFNPWVFEAHNNECQCHFLSKKKQ